MERNWWQKAVVYQIYPRSFKDSNGDGIGDLGGVIDRLDYLKALGVNLIWLSPVYRSPMSDNGYDISDYYHIDPVFGTDEDMDRLIAMAKERGIGIIMDLVVNHCSDEHEWFKKAKADPTGPYGSYFYIREGKGGKAPNNWRSIFGGSVWEPIEGTPYYYLHIFNKKQPDLNWECKELREEIYKMVNWWLNKGIAGFRLDAITYLKKAEGLPSFEADDEDGLVSIKYGCMCRKGIEVFLKELRDRTYGPANAMTVGETAGVGDDELLHFISEKNGYFSMIFDFSYCELNLKEPKFFWYDLKPWTADELKTCMFHMHELAGNEGWLGLCMENHDQPRSIDHYLPKEGRNFYGASMLAVLYFLRRGVPYIYQGQEIGMRNCNFPTIELYDDCSSLNQYAGALLAGCSEDEALWYVQEQSRDNARTPFLWNDSENAGFSTARPWLPVNIGYEQLNAKKQMEDKNSLWHWYQELIKLRNASLWAEVFLEGEMLPVFEDKENIVAYIRKKDRRRVLVLCNYSASENNLELPFDVKEILQCNYGVLQLNGRIIGLRPFEADVIGLEE